MRLLEGKIAVITGAGGGIGRSHAHLFAKLGAKVLVNDPGCNRDGSESSDAADLVVQEILDAGGEAVANKDAVGSSENADKIIQSAVDAFGSIDILVNNAGILRDRTILNMTDDEWDDVINVHLRGTFTCLRAAGRVMRDQGKGGRIINTSSTSGLLGNFGQSNYGAAKSGIHMLSRIASWELAKYHINVNAISPVAMTRMLTDLPQLKEKAETGDHDIGPETISPMVAFLASDEAKDISGMTFGIHGKHIFSYRMMTSHGADSNEEGGWTPEEIGKRLSQIVNW
ncbi:MAG: SDR family NAD(P)-dependent oxidoreductase [Verrucomicrobia bacterium]|nr:SDR family NAD(P)-dependent oxidoreductase [Verrucomicrobiota bacterium]MDA1067094.1 SDR family NAD(P)-dependent oxidoreductase [Verrucomicrobiota bacterium]